MPCRKGGKKIRSIQSGIFAAVACAGGAGENFVALNFEGFERFPFLRRKPGLIEAMEPRFGANEQQAIHDGEEGRDTGQPDGIDLRPTDGVEGEEALNDQQQGDGQIEDRNLTLEGLVGAVKIFGGPEDMLLQLSLAHGEIVKRFLKGHTIIYLAYLLPLNTCGG